MATFEFLRVSLARRPPDLFGPGNGGSSRREFLRGAFSHRWDFTHRRRIYTYAPLLEEGHLLGGVIGREFTEFVHDGPDTQWALREERHWPTAFCVLDSSEREQIAAVQRHSRVGSPKPLLLALLERVASAEPFSMWIPHVEYVSSEADFWRAAREYQGKITALNFTFVPPNMLRAKEAVDELVKAATEEANADTTELKLKNPQGALKPEGDLVEAAVSTATKGAGDVTMKAGRATIFSSSRNRKTLTIDSEDVPEPSSGGAVRKLFTRLIGHD